MCGSGGTEEGVYAVVGGVVGERFGFDGRRFVAEGIGKFEAGVKAGSLQLKPKLEVTKEIGESEVKSKFSWGMDVHTFKPGKFLGNDVSGNVRIKEDLTLEIGFSFHAGLWGLELKVRPYDVVDFVGGFFGFDPSSDNEERPGFGEHRPYRDYLHTEIGQPYLGPSGADTVKRDEAPGLDLRCVGLPYPFQEIPRQCTSNQQINKKSNQQR